MNLGCSEMSGLGRMAGGTEMQGWYSKAAWNIQTRGSLAVCSGALNIGQRITTETEAYTLGATRKRGRAGALAEISQMSSFQNAADACTCE